MRETEELKVRTITECVEEAMEAVTMWGGESKLVSINAYGYAVEVVLEVTEDEGNYEDSWYESHTFALSNKIPKETILESISNYIECMNNDVQSDIRSTEEALESINRKLNVFQRTSLITELEEQAYKTRARKQMRERA